MTSSACSHDSLSNISQSVNYKLVTRLRGGFHLFPIVKNYNPCPCFNFTPYNMEVEISGINKLTVIYVKGALPTKKSEMFSLGKHVPFCIFFSLYLIFDKKQIKEIKL